MDVAIRHRLFTLTGYGLLLFGTAYLSLRLLPSSTGLGTIWLAAGVAVACVIRLRKKALPIVFIACGAALWITGTPWEPSLALAAGATLEAWLASRMSQDGKRRTLSFYTPKGAAQFITRVAMLPAVVMALIGSYSLWLAGGISHSELASSLLLWWLSDVCGIVLIVPLVYSWSQRSYTPSGQGKFGELAILIVVTVALCSILFSNLLAENLQRYPLPYLTLMPVAWAVLRFHTRVTTLIVVTISLSALTGTQLGFGPFTYQSGSELMLQLYTLTLASGALLTKALLLQQVESESQLQLARKIVENTPDGLVITDSAGHILSANPAFYSSTGLKAKDIIGKPLRMLDSGHQDDAFHRQMREALEQDGEWQGEIWTRSKSGDVHPEWLHLTAIRNNLRTTHYLGIYSDIAQQKLMAARMHRLAYYDKLTELPNRELFQDRLNQAIKHAKRSGSIIALLFLDLDRFKHINDSLGHGIGDQLLAEAAQRLRQCIRSADSLARFGGDEFTLILQDIREDFDAILVAEKILQAFKNPFQLDQHKLYLTTSIGISIYPEHGESPVDLIKHADTAMYRAKAAGGNCYQLFELHMSEPFMWNLEVETALRRAIETKQIQLYYQPQFDLQTGAIVGLEALARWHDSKMGPIPPSTFIQISENTGLIHKLGEQILTMAGRQSLKWGKEGIQGLRVAVNVSTMQLKQPEFITQAKEIIELQRSGGNHLELEITESSMMENAEFMEAMLHRLSDIGVRIAIDDFGTGYSSLSYLKRLPISLLKIDKSFVKDLPYNEHDAAICRAVIAMAQSLNLRVLAEGVETEAQMRFLHLENCHEMQGYLHSRPVSAEEVSEMIRLGFWHITPFQNNVRKLAT